MKQVPNNLRNWFIIHFVVDMAGVDVYRAMLNLKVIWSGSAMVGIGLGLWMGGAETGWFFLGVFALFWFVWVYYRRVLK